MLLETKRIKTHRSEYKTMQSSRMRDLQTRLRHLDPTDGVAIVIFLLGLAGLFVLTLRHI
jgi:hypothetical protein